MDKGIDCCIVCWKGAPKGTPFDQIPHEEWCEEERKVAKKRGYIESPFAAYHEMFDILDAAQVVLTGEEIANVATEIEKDQHGTPGN